MCMNTHTCNMNTYSNTHIQAHITDLEIQFLFLHMGPLCTRQNVLYISSYSASSDFPPPRPPPLLPLSFLLSLFFLSSCPRFLLFSLQESHVFSSWHEVTWITSMLPMDDSKLHVYCVCTWMSVLLDYGCTEIILVYLMWDQLQMKIQKTFSKLL